MTVLSDTSIIAALKSSEIVIEPYSRTRVQSGSIALTLDSAVERIDFPHGKEHVIDLSDEKVEMTVFPAVTSIDIENGYVMQPHEYLTAYSAEYIRLPRNISGLLLNYEDLSHAGLNAALSPYLIPGFDGRKRIVLHNLSDRLLKIKPGMRICQMLLFKMDNAETCDNAELRSGDWLKRRVETEIRAGKKDYDTSISDFMDTLIQKVARGEKLH